MFYYSLIFISSSKIKPLIRCLKTNKSIYKFHWQQQQHKLILRVSQCRSFQWNLLLQHCKLGFQLPWKTLNTVKWNTRSEHRRCHFSPPRKKTKQKICNHHLLCVVTKINQHVLLKLTLFHFTLFPPVFSTPAAAQITDSLL